MSKTWALPSLQLSGREWGLGRMDAQNSSGSLLERRVRGDQVLQESPRRVGILAWEWI